MMSSGVVRSASSVECISPRHVAGLVLFDVVDTDRGITAGAGLRFSFVDPIRVSHVFPTSGSVMGGTRLSLSGSSFFPGLSCAFRSGDTTLSGSSRYVSSSSIECTTPSVQSPEMVELVLQHGATVMYDGRLTFQYQLPVEVYELHPSIGLQSGQAKVTILGRDFVSSDGLGCRFGLKDVSAVYLSSTAILTFAPVHAPGRVQVQATMNGLGSASLAFTFVPDVALTRVVPSSGRRRGGQLLTLSGGIFDERLNVSCAFGSTEVASNFVDATSMTCVTPDVPTTGLYQLRIQQGGGVAMPVGVDFEFVSELRVSTVIPSSVGSGRATSVFVVGEAFSEGSELRCLLSSQGVVQAGFLSSTLLRCVSGVLEAGTTVVQVSNDGHYFSSPGVQLEVLPSVEVLSVTPSVGTLEGQQVVTVIGTGFSQAEEVYCRFGIGASLTSADWFSSNEIRCLTPVARRPTAVQVSVTNDEAEHSSSSARYQYVAGFRVMGVKPSSGSVAGGTTVTVRVQGTDDFHAAGLMCKLGSVLVASTVVAPDEVTCVVPQHEAGRVAVAVTT
eukprot:71853-Rhodomonas_salina.1